MCDRVDPAASCLADTAIHLAAESRKNKGTSDGDKVDAYERSSPRRASLFQKISPSERHQLQRWARQRTSSYRLVVRSQIVLLASEGVPIGVIATRLHVTSATVRLWIRRFADGRLAALTGEAPGRGRPRGSSRAVTNAVLAVTRAHAARGLTVRNIAALAHTSPSTVWRIWRRYSLGPDSSSESIEAVLAQVIPETLGYP
jgi:Winged helix-turn helix